MQQTYASAGMRRNLLSKSYLSKSSNRVGTRRLRADCRFAKSIGIRALLGIFCAATVLFQVAGLYAQAADSSGLPTLAEVIAASGGRAAWGRLKDFRATGTMSLYSGDKITQSGRAELIGRGLKQFRLTANLGDQSRGWLWDRGFGRLDTGNGKPTLIGRHNLTALEAFNLPALKAIAFGDGPSRSVTLVGEEILDGTPAYRLRIARQAMNQEDEAALGRTSFQIDFLIDQKTFMVLAIEDTLYANNQPQGSFQHRLNYSDYRSVAGVQIPFRITERISGQITWDLQLDSYAADSGVAESEFIP